MRSKRLPSLFVVRQPPVPRAEVLTAADLIVLSPGVPPMREAVAAARAAGVDVPIVLFGYYNPVMSYGELKLATDAADAGADGFLVVDLPPEEAGPLREAAIARNMDLIPLIAPTSHEARVQLAASTATSFIYYVSMTGVTGAVGTDLHAAAQRAGELEAKIGKRIALGFGVSTPQDVQVVAKHVGGVVVGSAVVRAIEAAPSADAAVLAVSKLVASLAGATARG